TLSVMFGEAGHRMQLFDPFFADNRELLAREYDFVTASEVVEHFRDPAADLGLLWSLLRPGGWLGIMTKLALDEAAFSRWHYKNDPTHISFFSLQTLTWLGEQYQSELHLEAKDVFLFQKTYG
ncbi:MAG: class I SAM-dependent methyltransferase, partial [Thermodesulfobacteriota bacterium]